MPIVPIDELDDPRLEDYRNVPDPVLLRKRGLFVAESRLVVRELLSHQRLNTRSVLATPAAYDSLKDLLTDRTDNLAVYVASHQFLQNIVGFNVHRGCLAIGERPAPVTDRTLPALTAGRLVVVLERVSNPDNVGSIFRNAAAFGANGVLLSPGCGDPLYRKAIRTSLGATLRIPYGEVDDWPEGLTRLQELGFATMGMTLDPDAVELDALVTDAPTPIALLFGTEGTGLSDEAAALLDYRVRIPIADSVDSLNVATASGIALYLLSVRPSGTGR
ncbi:MAG: rRNA methyltransferase [Acidobacteria bacterium]|nr:rRNA methyltransferase [Acidobacteriota bacterium]